MLLCKVGDTGIGVCGGHVPPLPFVATIMSGSPTVNAEGMPAANTASSVSCSCGHNGFMMSGSTIVFINGLPAVRNIDIGVSAGGGLFNMMSGAVTVNAN